MKFIEKPASNNSLARRKPIYGVGINDAMYAVNWKQNGKRALCPYFRVWQNMLKRCYDEKYQRVQPNYRGCSVCKEWLTFSIFRKWMEMQDWRGNQLDKDLLNPGNRIYSAENCMFVSRQVNSALQTGVGYYLDKWGGRWRAEITAHGKKKHLGDFETKSLARNAYLFAKARYLRSISDSEPPAIRGALRRHADILCPEDQAA